MQKLSKFGWNNEKGVWAGSCPRCGMVGFYRPEAQNSFSGLSIDILHCPGGHIFTAEYAQNHRDALRKVVPREWFGDIPDWLPEGFHSTFQELIFVRGEKKFRSVVALSGLLLEAHVNEQIPTLGDRKKSLFDRLQYLKKQGKIDHDQFSDATITRLTRNEILHPSDLLAEIDEGDAEEAMNSVISYLERAYKYRSSRALPPGTNPTSITENPGKE